MRTSWLTRGGRWLSGHLIRLRRTLDALGSRLRETVATVVGQTVAVAVREAVHVILSDFSGSAPLANTPTRETKSAGSLWDQSGDTDLDPWHEDPGHFDSDDYLTDVPDNADTHDPKPRSVSRWPLAVVVGCQAAAWWLKRRLAKLPVLAAVAVGVLSALATYAGGPLTLAGVGLAGSALNLAGTAGALGAFGTS